MLVESSDSAGRGMKRDTCFTAEQIVHACMHAFVHSFIPATRACFRIRHDEKKIAVSHGSARCQCHLSNESLGNLKRLLQEHDRLVGPAPFLQGLRSIPDKSLSIDEPVRPLVPKFVCRTNIMRPKGSAMSHPK